MSGICSVRFGWSIVNVEMRANRSLLKDAGIAALQPNLLSIASNVRRHAARSIKFWNCVCSDRIRA